MKNEKNENVLYERVVFMLLLFNTKSVVVWFKHILSVGAKGLGLLLFWIHPLIVCHYHVCMNSVSYCFSFTYQEELIFLAQFASSLVSNAAYVKYLLSGNFFL